MFSKYAKPLLLAMAMVTSQFGLITGDEAQAGVPGSTSAINLDANGVALGGYDPVAYFEGGTPTKGEPAIYASYNGARYFFATAAHRRTFLKEPKKYIPEFGGYCVVGTAFGEKVDVDPDTGEVVNGKLYLNNNRKALEIFDKDREGTITKAQTNWPIVKDKAL
ncbi:MAG: tat pathway signal sequence domain protein [Gammaproteobacteria bacterium]|nr:tat pathway signal sequence domain protein [Gammaproteobacteria bacterium]